MAPPRDLSHYYSENAKNRQGSEFKKFYKYFAIKGIGNLAGGKLCESPVSTPKARALQEIAWTPDRTAGA
ncbi:hypothetical protein AWJ20_3920 [Sugiyamaella lignohabitans]|uniref:Uncharacterized protein n=1 Tax=Sugiyamaella lignohabitans TaxID=796027 RepID=A0A167C1Z0_9ASCO|nr:uncharacterized protein AWJ20_3920 [Sugiyamaella lignohabitans]ANB11122.1 hypothetical protein AWJ20_3920 [Sugiyamaella lignohabitans]